MGDLDLNGLTVARATRALRAREISPLELTDAYLDRIVQLDPRVNAYITVTAERARADARRATDELAAGRTRGPLHGIPVGTEGSVRDRRHPHDRRREDPRRLRAGARTAPSRRRLRDAGTILLGKLNTHEYAYGVTTNNPHFGATHNPWGLEHIPGGSSGGSGAAIAAGLATATTGTDTGGSIRIPASLCGVVGLKPTYGRVSKAGVLPLSYLFDHAGPLTRTVEDAALILNVIAGYDPADATSVRTPVDDYTGALGGGVRGLRVGVPRRVLLRTARRRDRGGGGARRSASCARSARRYATSTVAGVEAGWARSSVSCSPRRRRSMPTRCARGPATSAPTCARFSPTPDAGRALADARPARARRAERVDARRARIGRPAGHADDADRRRPDRRGDGPLRRRRGAGPRRDDPLHRAVQRDGLPALSLPCGFTRAGLPVGLQLVGRPFDEATVLRAGHAYEQATEWHTRKAPV